MQAVFLDKGTFSDGVDLPAPTGISDYVTYDDTPKDNEVILARCKDADIIITNKVQIDADVISKLPNLKLIQLTATGMNNVDQEACIEHNVALYNVAGYAVKSVPEHTFMLMLTAMRAGIYYHQKVADGTWQANGNFCLLDIPLIDLEDKTLGIIGVGTIGKRVTEIARAFGMTVLWAEHQGRAPRNDDYTAFDEVLARADVLSLHCPLNAQTQHLINKDTLAKMTKQPLIVNVARGGVVDSQALTDAINNEQIIGYASDVFEQEPIVKDDPLLTLANHPRVIFSPHNAWGSKSAQQTLWQMLSNQVADFIDSHQNSNG
ncbi:D-2-hydroxyacid dehydrogenase [Psychrobacter sp. N25K4-3-2]|uniref:D-2-hydroxyacid dehydrogenase n=1 Tax=Psychrobacter sp. N25K4-3-2 TaxID=2785026 RepID=UPI00188A9DFE|nr:D-2-hydroxyacid dehydrogenase [Psychrobacter sp. N25K4-3-2]MBF4490379.1 D-2-hydroxyacid dehydrogenase [Psychrobacter sp. N25K4-3-2]